MYGSLIDQLSDKELNHLPEMLLKLLPGNIMGHDINPLEELLPALMSKGSPAHMIMMSMPTQGNVEVKDLPGGGKMIIKKMRSGHASFMGNDSGDGLRRILENKGECALGDKFPVSDPLQAMMSLLYAHGQKDKMDPGTVEAVIEPKVAEVTGSKLVEDIRNFVESVGKGTKEFADSEYKAQHPHQNTCDHWPNFLT